MEETIKHIMLEMGVAAKSAAVEMNKASTEQKNLALQAIAGEILARRSDLMLENEKDLEAARANGISDALLDRIDLYRSQIQ
jgi:glutamate-5-semialdehyde dehydrogenase